MQVVKAVQQNYSPTAEILDILDEFRSMVNHCIRIGLQEDITSLKALSSRTYRQLNDYNAMSYYKLCAISAAVGVLRNYRKASRQGQRPSPPYARKLRVTTCYGFRMTSNHLLLPVQPRRSVCIPLNKHTLQTISGHEVRSVTLTPHKLSIAFTKDVKEINSLGFMGVDRNLDNVTLADTDSQVRQIDLSKATEIKSMYRNIKSKFQRNDTRIRRKISQKYGLKERAKVQQILHHVSKQIVREAKRNQYGVAMENLTNLRKLYRRRNGQGAKYRFRLNSWSYAELQRQIEYKARWEGLPVILFYLRTRSWSLILLDRERRLA
jgi:putative transposase